LTTFTLKLNAIKKLLLLLFLGFTLLGFSQNTLIPDPNFEQALIDLAYDTAPINGSVPTANISGVTYLDVFNNNITDLTGIEDFTALTFLSCVLNQLTSLDVSTNTALMYLYCGQNPLTSLDVRNGNNSLFTDFYSTNNPNLTCIFVDDASYSTTNWTDVDVTTTFVNNEAACAGLSIEDNAFGLGVSVYPNPTDNYLFIEGNKNPISISIYNLLGKKVISTKNTNRIDVKELSSGVYIINISDGISQTDRKFVKN
jgi:hypothetical protein